MSGQPYRYAKDVENFRNEYMDALNTISNINDMNLQANKNYKETGALPPQSSMKDMRTTSEILADVEKLKLSIVGEFKGLCSPNMAMSVIQKVQASPLNGDGSFLTWLAQNSTELVTQLKRKYKFGIEGNENDVNTMYLFLQSIYSKSKEMNSTVKSAFDRPTGGLNGGLQPGDLDALKKKYEETQYRLISKNVAGGLPQSRLFSESMRNINDKFNELSKTVSTNIYTQLKDIFLRTSQGTNSATQTNVNRLGYSDWIEFTDKLPSSSALNALLEQLEKSERNSNIDLTLKILQNIDSMLPTLTDIQEANNISDNIIRTNGRPLPAQPGLSRTGAFPFTTPPPLKNVTPLIRTDVANALFDNVKTMVDNVVNYPEINDDNKFKQYINEELKIIEDGMTRVSPNWKTDINYNHDTMIKTLESLTNNYNYAETTLLNLLKQSYIDSYKAFDTRNPTQIIGVGIRRKGRPKGSGIVKPLHDRIDSNMGIKQGHTHVPFGRYLLNRNRLDEDIFSFKHNKGYGIRGYPSKKISRNLSNVFKTIVGGGIPKYDDLANLSNDEKTYLHTVSKKAGIIDKLSIPTPCKDSMDKDIHQFEVMKGEILAGNDSSVLIKNFKLLLLKLSKTGALPKREVSEVMENLLTLGY